MSGVVSAADVEVTGELVLGGLSEVDGVEADVLVDDVEKRE